MTERQLVVAVLAGGTILALYIVIVLWAWLGYIPVPPVTNTQLPTL